MTKASNATFYLTQETMTQLRTLSRWRGQSASAMIRRFVAAAYRRDVRRREKERTK